MICRNPSDPECPVPPPWGRARDLTTACVLLTQDPRGGHCPGTRNESLTPASVTRHCLGCCVSVGSHLSRLCSPRLGRRRLAGWAPFWFCVAPTPGWGGGLLWARGLTEGSVNIYPPTPARRDSSKPPDGQRSGLASYRPLIHHIPWQLKISVCVCGCARNSASLFPSNSSESDSTCSAHQTGGN